MPAKNIYHDAVINALKADGWTITNDPLSERFGQVIIDRLKLRVLVFDERRETVVRWIG